MIIKEDNNNGPEELFYRVTGWGSIIAFILLMLVLSSCSILKPSDERKANRKLRKAERLINQARALGITWEADTVYREIKVTIPETKFDSVVKVVNWRDTIILTKDRVRTRVLVTPETKTVYIDYKCDSVVVVKRVPYVVNKSIEVKDSNLKRGMWSLLGFFLCFLFVVVAKWLRLIK